MKSKRAASIVVVGLTVVFASLLLLLALPGRVRAEVPSHLGYGFNVAEWEIDLIQDIGFDWIKVFNAPNYRLPLNVLVRFDAQAQDLADTRGFGDRLAEVAARQGAYIEAYEIGNEVNLDAEYGWTAAPVAADYVTLLCEAYRRIKAGDPASVVVSAGLAPTGRVSGEWEGHLGHNGFFQDEREYLKEFLAAGGAECADAIGYHPYGFRADYDAAPDSFSADPTLNCTNGFCFRGVEKIYKLLVENGVGGKPLWATEFGWIVRPPDDCLSDPGFDGREWQLVSEAEQTANVRGAYQYAHEHWPWMGAMFLFNLNFNDVPWYDTCEQMRYYAIEDRPAEQALRELVEEPVTAILEVAPTQLAAVTMVGQQPSTITRSLSLENVGWQPLVYSLTAGDGPPLVAVDSDNGTLQPQEAETLQVTIDSEGLPAGRYTTTIVVEAGAGTRASPAAVAVTLLLVEELHTIYLPLHRR